MVNLPHDAIESIASLAVNVQNDEGAAPFNRAKAREVLAHLRRTGIEIEHDGPAERVFIVEFDQRG